MPRRSAARRVADCVFRTAMRKSVLAIADQGFVSGANFATGVIIGRACTKEGFGLYMLGFTVVVFLLELQTSVITTPYMVYGPRMADEARRRYTGSTLFHQAVVGIVASVGFLGAAVVCSFDVGPEGFSAVAWPLVAVVGFLMAKDYIRRVCFANLHMATALILDATVAVLQLAGLLALAAAGVLGPARAYWIIGGMSAVATVVWVAARKNEFRVEPSAIRPDFGLNWRFGRWVFASALVWGVSMNFYPWLLAVFHDTAATGAWGACLGIIALANVLLMGVQNYLGPKFATVYAERGAAALRRYVLGTCAVFCVPMVPFCAALWWLGDPLVVLLYGEKYAGNGFIVALLSVNLLALAVAFSFSRALFVIERADVDFAVNFVALLVLLSFGIWMVRSYSVLGAACGLLAANVAALATRGFAFAGLVRPRTEVLSA
ncbi:MAG TPA: hypothetical protein PLO37_10585 [Candidatus Hydrogenedentes bacterium]|nr:hypothetical protein [Candidatus Hydrogenedentota bacterium]